MQIAVVGGGITGIAAAYELARRGHHVDLFEKDTCMSQTSCRSTKLIHGGLRYLENLQFSMVRESLMARKWWYDNAPKNLIEPIEIIIPLYENNKRSSLAYNIALTLYDRLAGDYKINSKTKLDIDDVLRRSPNLNTDGLSGGYSFYDLQMKDRELGLWLLQQAKALGVMVYENTQITRIENDCVRIGGYPVFYNRIINACGPWAELMLKESDIKSKYHIDHIQGSHLLLDRNIAHSGHLLESVVDDRVFFVLPYFGKTLIGTTESRHEYDAEDLWNIKEAPEKDVEYLIKNLETYFPNQKYEIEESFSGCRPLIKHKKNPSKSSREFIVEKQDKVLSVFGGKWTTSMIIAQKVAELI